MSVNEQERLSVKLAITCGISSGVLASIVVAIRKANLEVEDQTNQDLGDYRMVEIRTSATKAELLKVRSMLLELADIVEVKAFAMRSKEAGETAVATPTSSKEIVNKLVLNFPNVASTVLSHCEELNHDEIPAILFSIGVEVAEQRESELASAGANADVAEVMNKRVIPDLQAMATLEYAESGYETGLKIMVSDFTRPNKKADGVGAIHTFGSLEAEAMRCDFLAGYIQGVVQSNPSTSQVAVKEIHCRNEGHPYCLFECS